MQKQVDPQNTGSFDINALVSLVALQPKQNDTLEDMIESLRIIGSEGGGMGRVALSSSGEVM